MRKLHRRDLLLASLGLAAHNTLSSFSLDDLSRKTTEKPNIVFVLVDDVGYNTFSPYGGIAFQTPHIDRLAKNGIVFTQCHSRAMCAPTRQVFTTGKSLCRGHVNDIRPTVAHILKRAGYRTCISGKWMLGRMEPWARGFDEGAVQVNGFRFWSPHVVVYGSKGYLREHNLKKLESRNSDYKWPIDGTQPGAVQLKGEYGPDVSCRFVCDFIRRHLHEPFFVYMPMKLGHVPFVPTPLTAMGLKEKTIIQQMTDEEDPHSFGRLSYRDAYEADNIKYIDVVVGRVIETLEKCNLLENTILVFTSDNGPGVMGEAVGGGLLPDQRHKGGILDAATRVPCIVHWPKGAPAGARCNDLVDFTDFLPTFAEAAGDELSSGASFDGRSFLAQLRGEQGNPRDWIYIHGGSHPNPGWRDLSKRVRYDKPDPWSCRYIRGRRYKLYADSRFYDMRNDIEEERPIKPNTAGQDTEQIREEYKRLLDKFAREAKYMQRKDPVFIYE